MKFILNTKPLVESINLGVINSNVKKNYRISTMLQIKADKSLLTLNTTAANILSEMKIRGSGDSEEDVISFVDAIKFKNLLSTIEAASVTIEFVDGGIILHAGGSKFTFPSVVDADDNELPSPELPDYNAPSIEIKKDDWKFIQDSQMYAISESFIHPVYTNVWISDEGSVLVGDFDTSLFTHSKKCNLGETCLLTTTIVNLLNSVPEGAKLVKMEKGYQIQVSNDAYEYVAQFVPKHEDDPDCGDYHAKVILEQFKADDAAPHISVPLAAIKKIISQAGILADGNTSKIKVKLADKQLKLENKDIDGIIPVKGDNLDSGFESDFYFNQLNSVISHFSEETIHIVPIIRDEVTQGLIVWDKDLQTVLSGADS